MVEDIEYFEILNPKHYWLIRWLKKPNKDERLKSRNMIIATSQKMVIGINKPLIDKIINDFISGKKEFSSYNLIDNISNNLQLPAPLIKIVLNSKKMIKNVEASNYYSRSNNE